MGRLPENWLLTCALACSLVGIMALFIISQNTEPPTMKIAQISEKNLGDYVLVEGVVCRLRESKGNQFPPCARRGKWMFHSSTQGQK